MQLKVAKEFSHAPGARRRSEGTNSAEQFRDELLVPRLREAVDAGCWLTVDLDGTAGIAASFLDEAFGGLVREGFAVTQLLNVLRFKSDEEPWMVDDIWSYIRDSAK